MESIIEKYYYIIKVDCGKTRKTYYKIGEAANKNRPENLVEKYNKYSSNNASIVSFEKLPYKGEKRLNDKLIHKSVDSSILVKANEYEIQVELGEVDGKDEFFELVDKSIDIIMYINSVVASIKPSHYTAKVTKNTTLVYDADTYHKVDSDLLDKITNKFTDIDNLLYRSFDKTILLIGQFEFDFIASFAMSHLVIIWHDSADNKHTYSYSKLNNNIIYVDTLQEVFDLTKEINLIIANPPYGKIGANITNAIIDSVDFDEYINLLPANDYKRNDNKDLFNYQSNMESIRYGFDDAAVTTHVAKIHKTKVNNMTTDEFERSQYIDRSLDKYFEENSKRSHYAIDKLPGTGLTIKNAGIWTTDTTFIFHNRDMNHRSLSGDGSVTYDWNIKKAITFSDLINRKAHTDNTQLTFCNITFDTKTEKDNFTNFIYSNIGYKFICKVFTALNIDMGCKVIAIPKVDWTRSWTVEEILADYSYDADEIKEVMEDLKNFKGMED